MKEAIESLMRRRKISKMEFYNLIGMSATGYKQMFENDSMKVSTLKRIAEILEVDISHFFSGSNSGSSNELLELLKENRELRKRIDELEKNQTAHSGAHLPKLKEKS